MGAIRIQDPRLGISGFIQGSTCGYFGHLYLNDLGEALDGVGANLPDSIPGDYYVYRKLVLVEFDRFLLYVLKTSSHASCLIILT